MKKSVGVVGVVFALAVAYGGASWYVGQRAQDIIETAVAKGNGHLGQALGAELSTQPLQLSISRYDRGWFSSSVIYSLKFSGTEGQVTEFLLADKLQHGPFPWSAVSQGRLAPVLALSNATLMPSAGSQRWFDSLKGRSPLSIQSHLDFNGAGESHWQFEPLDYTEKEGNKVSFSGGHLKLVFTRDFDSINTEGQFNKFQLSVPDQESLSFDGVSFSKSYVFGDATSSQTADIRLKVETSVYTDAEQGAFRVQGLNITGQSVEHNGLFDGGARYDVDSVYVSDVNLGKVSAAFQANRVNVQALKALTSTYDDILSEQGLSEDDMPELDNEDILRLREHLFELLKSKPSLAMNPFIWDNGDGQSQVGAQVDFVRPDFALVDAPTQELLMQTVGAVDLSLSINKSMFAKAYVQAMSEGEDEARAHASARMIFDLYAGVAARAGLAQYADGVLTSKIRYKDQKIIINGATLSIPEFLERLSSTDL